MRRYSFRLKKYRSGWQESVVFAEDVAGIAPGYRFIWQEVRPGVFSGRSEFGLVVCEAVDLGEVEREGLRRFRVEVLSGAFKGQCFEIDAEQLSNVRDGWELCPVEWTAELDGHVGRVAGKPFVRVREVRPVVSGA